MDIVNKIRFAKLLEPAAIGKVKTRNRIIKTASGAFFLLPDGYLGERAKAYYESFARGGAGLIIMESCGVEYPLGVQHPIQFHLEDDKYIPSYREVTEAVHKHGCPVFLQFQHAGPWNPTGLLPKRDTIAASTLTRSELPGPDFDVPRGLSLDEVKKYVDIWVNAVVRAEEAGFDGVEINGATCHFINTFFSRIWNKRDDEYGYGSLENRARFMCDIVREAKKRTDPDFVVTVLINIAEYGHEKATAVAEGVSFAKLLEKAGADAVQVRAHAYGEHRGLLQPDRFFYPEAPETLPEGLDWNRKGTGAIIPLADSVKKAVSVPVFCACRLDPIIGEKFLREGKLDFVGMTRRLLADPELPNKVAAGRLEDIRPCMGCLYCRNFILKNEPLQCRVNAALGREHQYKIKPAENKKRVMIIGGGPAGMEVARVAALKGHEVTLFEKEHILGGLVPFAALVNDTELDDLVALVRYFKVQLERLGVKIRLGKKGDFSTIQEFKPDVVILAIGAKAGTFDLEGLDGSNVIASPVLHRKLKFYLRLFGVKTLNYLTRLWMPIGRTVVIMGGNIKGLQLAEFLVKRHRRVTIVDNSEITGDGMTIDNRRRLFRWLDKKRVSILPEVKYEKITKEGLIVINREGKRITIESDTILWIAAFHPDTGLIRELEGKVPEIHSIGDCREPHQIADAITDGWLLGCEI